MNEYWVVVEKSTGRVIAHCGEERDAMMMFEFDPQNRTYRRQQFILDQVVDVTSTTDKQLPGQIGLPEGQMPTLNSYRERLPQNQQEPLKF